jgi:hypothetical protein
MRSTSTHHLIGQIVCSNDAVINDSLVLSRKVMKHSVERDLSFSLLSRVDGLAHFDWQEVLVGLSGHIEKCKGAATSIHQVLGSRSAETGADVIFKGFVQVSEGSW